MDILKIGTKEAMDIIQKILNWRRGTIKNKNEDSTVIQWFR